MLSSRAALPITKQPLADRKKRGSLALLGWAPDGSWVLVASKNNGGQTVFQRTYPPTGITETVHVTSEPDLIYEHAALSPDGTQVVLERGQPRRPGRKASLVLLNLNTGDVRDLGVSGRQLRPAWSPDGTEIVVSREPRPGAPEVLIVPLNGSPPRPLFKLAATTQGLDVWRTFQSVGWPTWSPDGRYIAFILSPPEAQGARQQLLVMPAAGGLAHVAYATLAAERTMASPRWSPDGSGLFFTMSSWETRVWMMRDFLMIP